MEKQTNLSIIRDRIRQSEYGTVYVAVDFVDISDKTNINAYLARLAEEGLIRRVMRGVYYKAEYSPLASMVCVYFYWCVFLHTPLL